METVIFCPHPHCKGYMHRVRGGETEWKLECDTCSEFYYKIGPDITCIRCCTPKNTEAADALLAFPHGQNLKREIVDKLDLLRKRFGLEPFSQPLRELGQTDD